MVWPSDHGASRGASLVPLIPSAPELSRDKPPVYELLAIADVFRVGRARERKFATELLHERLRRSLEATP